MILTTMPATNVRTARRGDGGLHPRTPSQLTLSAGAGQTAIAGAAVAIPPAVLVRDQLDRPVAGVPMQFVVVGGSSASQVTVDSFTRANENPLAGTWSKAGGAATNLQLLNNTIRGVTASGEGLMYSTAAAWPADQYSECQLLVGDPGGGGPAVRMSAGAESAYIAQATVGVVSLCKFVAGTFGILQQVGTTLASTDTLRLEARGSTLRMYKNGVQLGTDVLDASLSTGAPGLDLFSNTTFTITRWAAGVPPTTSGTVTPDTPVVTDASGLATVTAWTLGTVPGVNTLTVTSAGLVGSPVSVTATGTGGSGVATQIALNAGNNQSAVAGTNVATPPSVIVRDAGGAPVAGVLVTFAVASGGGSVTGASQNTNASGIATVGSWTLGATAGTNTLTASSAGLTGSPVTVTATGTTPVVFDFYVSTTGGTGTGAIGDPWSLSYALGGAGGAITSGKIVALRGGTYTGTFTSSLNGTAASPIIVRQYPGERATINGTLFVQGSYVWMWGFEVMRSAPTADTHAGVYHQAPGSKLINLVVHDASASGILTNPSASNSEIHGCLVYNNGTVFNQDHGIYATNTTGTKLLTDNIVFNNLKYGVQLNSPIAGELNGIYLDGNVGFGNGSISVPGVISASWLLGADVANIHDGRLTNNYTYETASSTNWAANIGYFDVNHDMVVTGNTFVGFTEVAQWTTLTMTGNTFIARGGNGNVLSTVGSLAGFTWATNVHYGAGTLWGTGDAANFTTFASWKAATGLGGSDTNPAAAPTGTQVIVRPNAYEAGRGHLIIYNWDQAASVSVNLSTVLAVGQTYTIVNAQDVYGTAVASGTYAGGSVSLTMAGIAAPTPIGRGIVGPTTGPTFQVFIVQAT